MSRIFNPQDKVLCHLDTVDKYLKNQKYDPITIEIDPSNSCNHSCPFCISGHLHLKKFKGTELFNRTMLSEPVFQNLIEDLTLSMKNLMSDRNLRETMSTNLEFLSNKISNKKIIEKWESILEKYNEKKIFN